MEAFLQAVEGTPPERLSGLVQKFLPPVCTSEPVTRKYVQKFVETFQQRQTPILEILKLDSGDVSEEQKAELVFLQKLICVTGHISKVVPWKKPFAEQVHKILQRSIVPTLELLKAQFSTHAVALKSEVFETTAKFVEGYETEASPLFPPIFSHLEAYYQAVMDDKTDRIKEASDLLDVLLLTSQKVPLASLIVFLTVSCKMFSTREVATKLDQLNLIGNIAEKILHFKHEATEPKLAENFPLEEIWRVADFLATQIMPNRENLEVWFESSVQVLSAFCGLASWSDLTFQTKIFSLFHDVVIQQLKDAKHATKSEREFNLSLVQELGHAIELSDEKILQPFLLDYYQELRDLNLSGKKYAASNEAKAIKAYQQKLRSEIIKTIATVIKSMDNFVEYAEQFLKETAKELADPIVLADFIVALRDHADQYLGRVLKLLFSQLERDTTSMKVKKSIIRALSSIITHTKSAFLPYLEQCAKTLQPIATIALSSELCVDFITLYTSILVTFSKESVIDYYLPIIVNSFMSVLLQDSVDFEDDQAGEEQEMDLSHLAISEVLSQLKIICSNQQLIEKVVQVCPTFLPELVVYLSDHVPKEIIFEDEAFVRIAQLELVQTLLLLPTNTTSTADLSTILDLILQTSDVNKHETNVQLAIFETIHQFLNLNFVKEEKTKKKIEEICEKLLRDEHFKTVTEKILILLKT